MCRSLAGNWEDALSFLWFCSYGELQNQYPKTMESEGELLRRRVLMKRQNSSTSKPYHGGARNVEPSKRCGTHWTPFKASESGDQDE